MNVRNCRKCGKIFNYVMGAPLCPVCREEMEKKFHEVKKFIQDHPGVGIPEVSEACEVEPSQIRQWVREERLEFAEGSVVDIACEKCGTPIRTGRFCDKCKAGMINTMNSVYKKPQAGQPLNTGNRDNPRMRYLDN